MVFNSQLAANPEEAACLASFKEALAQNFEIPKLSCGPPLDHDLTLLRFVRGYHLNLKDATKAFGEMLAYRAANKIDEAREAMYAAKSAEDDELAWPATGISKFEPLVKVTGGGLMRRIGQSANGCPATLCLIHLYDVKAVVKAGLGDLLVELQQWQDEWWGITLLQKSEQHGSMLARVDVVHVAELSLFHFDISASKQLMKVLEGSKHYPESSARIVSSGNGKALLAMYNAVIKPFMPAHTKQKLLVLGKDIEKPSNKEAIGFDEKTFSVLLDMCGRSALGGAAIDVSDS